MTRPAYRDDYADSLDVDRHDTDWDDLAEREQAEVEDAWDRAHDHVIEDRIAQSAVDHVAWAYDQLEQAMGGEAS